MIGLILGNSNAEPKAKFFKELEWVLPGSKF